MKGYMDMLHKRDNINAFIGKNEKYLGDIREYFKTEIKAGETVLDYGCGDGSFSYDGLEVDGLDIDPLNEKAKLHDISELKKKYDIIVMSHVLEHMGEPDQEDILKRLRPHVCKKLIIAVPNSTRNLICDMRFREDRTHKTRTDTPDFLVTLEKQGYKIEKIVMADIDIDIKKPGAFIKSLIRIIFNESYGLSSFKNFIVIARPN